MTRFQSEFDPLSWSPVMEPFDEVLKIFSSGGGLLKLWWNVEVVSEVGDLLPAFILFKKYGWFNAAVIPVGGLVKKPLAEFKYCATSGLNHPLWRNPWNPECRLDITLGAGLVGVVVPPPKTF